jgi:hypothetical protein
MKNFIITALPLLLLFGCAQKEGVKSMATKTEITEFIIEVNNGVLKQKSSTS